MKHGHMDVMTYLLMDCTCCIPGWKTTWSTVILKKLL